MKINKISGRDFSFHLFIVLSISGIMLFRYDANFKNEYRRSFMRKMKTQDIYGITIVGLLILVVFLIWSFSNMVYRVNNTIYINSSNTIKLFGYIMEDYNEIIMEVETTTEKYDSIKKMLPRLDRLSTIMNNSRFNEDLSSKIEPVVDYLAGLNDSSLLNDTEYLNDTIEKINKVYIISQKIAGIPSEEFYATDFSRNYYYQFKFNFNHNFELAPKVKGYFDEINSIVEDGE